MIIFAVFIISILFAISVHEYAHAKVADMLGDPTPRMAGRLTLNPVNHIDPIGFIMLIVARIGWAKPVPVNPYNFRDPVKGEMLVSLAGPLSNILLAWCVATLIRVTPLYYLIMNNAFVVSVISDFIYINIALAVFNLLPIPPLDGSKLMEPFLPYNVRETLEQYGFFILLFILMFPPTSYFLFYIIRAVFQLIV